MKDRGKDRNDLKTKKKEALDYTLLRTCFGRGHRFCKTDYIMNENRDIVLKLIYED